MKPRTRLRHRIARSAPNFGSRGGQAVYRLSHNGAPVLADSKLGF